MLPSTLPEDDMPIFSNEALEPKVSSQPLTSSKTGEVYSEYHRPVPNENAWTRKDIPTVELSGVANMRNEQLVPRFNPTNEMGTIFDMNPQAMARSGPVTASQAAISKDAQERLYQAGSPSFYGYVQPRGLVWPEDLPQPSARGVEGNPVNQVGEQSQKGRIQTNGVGQSATAQSVSKGQVIPISSSEVSAPKLPAATALSLPRETYDPSPPSLELLEIDSEFNRTDLKPEIKKILDEVTVEQFLRRRLETGKLVNERFYQPAVSGSGLVHSRTLLLVGVSVSMATALVAFLTVVLSQLSEFTDYRNYLALELALQCTALYCGLIAVLLLTCKKDDYVVLLNTTCLTMLVAWAMDAGLGTVRLRYLADAPSAIAVALQVLTVVIWFAVLVVAYSRSDEPPVVTIPNSKAFSASNGVLVESAQKSKSAASTSNINLYRIPYTVIDMDLALRELVRLSNELHNSESNAIQERRDFQLRTVSLTNELNAAKMKILQLEHTNKVLGAQVVSLVSETSKVDEGRNLAVYTEAKMRELERARREAQTAEANALAMEKSLHEKDIARLQNRITILETEVTAQKAIVAVERSALAQAEKRLEMSEKRVLELFEENQRNREKIQRAHSEVAEMQDQLTRMMARCRAAEEELAAERAFREQNEAIATRGLQLQTTLDEWQSKLEQAQQEVYATRLEKSNMEFELEQVKARLAQLESQQAEKQTSLLTHLDDVKSSLPGLRRAIALAKPAPASTGPSPVVSPSTSAVEQVEHD